MSQSQRKESDRNLEKPRDDGTFTGFCCIRTYGRVPTQARFWLEWGCSHVTDLAGEPAVRDGIEIESEWTARKRDRAARNSLSSHRTAPLKPTPGLSGPPFRGRRPVSS